MAGLEGLRFRIPGEYRYGASDVAAVVDDLGRTPGNFFLLGDSAYLYALTGRPSAGISLWLHPGLTMPMHGNEAYERRLLRRLVALDVRYLVLEGKSTWMDVSLSRFARLARSVRQDEPRRFGRFCIVGLDPVRLRREAGSEGDAPH